MDIWNGIVEAEKRIAGKVLKTPLLKSLYLSELTGANVYLKLENEQLTGSFKIRGATNKIAKTIQEEEEERLKRGTLNQIEEPKIFVTASTGNHALAMATALQRVNRKGIIVLPNNIAPNKKVALQRFTNVDLILHGNDCVEAELFARNMTTPEHDPNGYKNKIFVSPYNDPDIVSGQGTIALEIVSQFKEQNPDNQAEIDAVMVTVGGGGLIGGIATGIKTLKPNCLVIGCQPLNDHVMKQSIDAGHILETFTTYPTLSGASAGGIEPGSITFELCQKYINSFVLTTEVDFFHFANNNADTNNNK